MSDKCDATFRCTPVIKTGRDISKMISINFPPDVPRPAGFGHIATRSVNGMTALLIENWLVINRQLLPEDTANKIRTTIEMALRLGNYEMEFLPGVA